MNPYNAKADDPNLDGPMIEPITNVNVRTDQYAGAANFDTGTSNHSDNTEALLEAESLYVHDGPGTFDEDEDNVVIGDDELDEVDEIEDDNLDEDLGELNEEELDDDVLTSPNRRDAGTMD